LWVGIGCGVLFVIGGASAAWFGYSSYQTYEQAKSAVAAASGLGATISVSDAGVVVKLPGLGEVDAPVVPTATTTSITPSGPVPHGGAATPGGTASASAAPTPTLVVPTPSSGLGTGGPSCDAAAACCKAMAAKAGGQAAASCDALKSSPEFACAQALATYKKMAPLVGATCP
jgi:hypothetical protein